MFRAFLTTLITLLVSISWLLPAYTMKYTGGPVGILYIPIAVLTGVWLFIIYKRYYQW